MSLTPDEKPALPGTRQSQQQQQEILRARDFDPRAGNLAAYSAGMRDNLPGVGINLGAHIAAERVDQEMLALGIDQETRMKARELVRHAAVGRPGAERETRPTNRRQQGAPIELDQPIAEVIPDELLLAQGGQPGRQPQGVIQGIVQPLPQAITEPLAQQNGAQRGQFVPAFQLDPSAFAEHSTGVSSNSRLMDAYRREVSESRALAA